MRRRTSRKDEVVVGLLAEEDEVLVSAGQNHVSIDLQSKSKRFQIKITSKMIYNNNINIETLIWYVLN